MWQESETTTRKKNRLRATHATTDQVFYDSTTIGAINTTTRNYINWNTLFRYLYLVSSFKNQKSNVWKKDFNHHKKRVTKLSNKYP